LQTTCIGSAFGGLVAGLQAGDPIAFAALGEDIGYELLRNIAAHQKLLGRLMTYAGEASGEEIAQLGWLIAALAEISLCWQEAIAAQQNIDS
jgi:hypothetical protein